MICGFPHLCLICDHKSPHRINLCYHITGETNLRPMMESNHQPHAYFHFPN
jgi:hypothetical protein